MKDYTLLDDEGQATGLSNFLAAHRGYRRDASRFPAGVRGLAAKGMPADGVEALRRHWRGYDQVLLAHHEAEDSFIFPLYGRSHPELADVIARLEDQHHDLDARIADIDAWLAKLPDLGIVEPLAAALDAFEAAIITHLDLEEEHIVPLMVLDPPVPPQFAEGSGRDVPPPPELDVAFVGPWMIDGLDDDVASALIAAAPPPWTADFDAKRRRYQEQLALWSNGA
jgi:hypothetical protein